MRCEATNRSWGVSMDCAGRDLQDASACARFEKSSKHGEDVRHPQRLLAASVASIVDKGQERAVASLFSPGGTHALKGEFAGASDFEVLAYLIVLAGPATPTPTASAA